MNCRTNYWQQINSDEISSPLRFLSVFMNNWINPSDEQTWKRCRNVRCRTSKMQTSPFLPAEIRSWCCGANAKLEAPWSWHANAAGLQVQSLNMILRLLQSSFELTCNHRLLLRQQRVPDGDVFTLRTMTGCAKEKQNKNKTINQNFRWFVLCHKTTNLLRPNCTSRGTWSRWWACCDIRESNGVQIKLKSASERLGDYLQRMIDYIATRGRPARDSIYHHRRRCRICCRAARIDIA